MRIAEEEQKVLNFTVGPVMSHKEILEIAGSQTPYFRTAEFSGIMLDNERRMLECLHAPEGSRCVFLTTSGTGGMEACVAGLLSEKDKAAVINGGTFGQRFAELCRLHNIPHVEVSCEFGKQVDRDKVRKLAGQGVTALLVNMDETSSGVLYDMEFLSDFCRANSIFLIVDIISSFLTDEFDMAKLGANVAITASQKALALQPGAAIVALDPAALERVYRTESKYMYLSLKAALENMERGQTPFTPAVSIMLQLNARLKLTEKRGGVGEEIGYVRNLAGYFRSRIAEYPFKLLVDDPADRSNAVTALWTERGNAHQICGILKDQYDIWICPNGGVYKDNVFRVGHLGALTVEDYDVLTNAFDKLRAADLL